MKLHFIVLALCLTSISAFPSVRRLRQVAEETDEGVSPDGQGNRSNFSPSPTLDTDIDPTCRASLSSSAMSRRGRLFKEKTEDRLACCVKCQGVPNSECRTWWRAQGSNRVCYLNSKRP